MSVAIVFAGQGTQHPDMLPWLAEDDLVRDTCARLGTVDWRSRVADHAWAAANANAQVLLTGLALAAWQQVSLSLPKPLCVAGYSVGELASFSAAGVFDPCRALDLAAFRAQAMDRCAESAPGGLLAIGGLDRDAVAQLCIEAGVDLAIDNGAGHAVLGGPEAALASAGHRAAQSGARVTRLSVGVASHTAWMRGAAEAFAAVLKEEPLRRPSTILFSNAAGRVLDAGQAGAALATQIASTVHWVDCMEAIHARAPSCVLEIGPGQALARMWNQRYPDVPARSCDDFRSTSALTAWVAGFDAA